MDGCSLALIKAKPATMNVVYDHRLALYECECTTTSFCTGDGTGHGDESAGDVVYRTYSSLHIYS
jgi:hypothetical protein